jgi:hypothetical protein
LNYDLDTIERKEELLMLKLLTTSSHRLGKTNEPVFVIQDGKLYRTIYHPAGWSALADYELKNDGKIYRTQYHRLGPSDTPDYEFRKSKRLYRTSNHPEGPNDLPEYELFD